MTTTEVADAATSADLSTRPVRRRWPRRPPRIADDLPDGVRRVVEPWGWAGPSRPGLRVARQRGTTAHVAAIYPFQGGHALAGLDAPLVGVNMTDGGSAWTLDPFELYGRDLGGGVALRNSNMLVLGEPGNGKSAFPKTAVWRANGFYGSRRFAAISDPKGEYGPLAEALGLARIRLRPGGTERLNPLDPGPNIAESYLARQTLLVAMLGSVMRRDPSNIEEAFVSIAVKLLDERHHGRPPATLVDLAGLLAELSADVANHPHLSMLSARAVREALTALRIALVKLLEHTLRGRFDGASTVSIDWSSSPGVVIDLSSVFNHADALPLVQMTTNSWLADARVVGELRSDVVLPGWIGVVAVEVLVALHHLGIDTATDGPPVGLDLVFCEQHCAEAVPDRPASHHLGVGRVEYRSGTLRWHAESATQLEYLVGRRT